jgi:hypothetical protein
VDGQSDQDFIVIVHDGHTSIDKAQWECNNEQYSIYTASTWQEKLNRHDIDALECYFLPHYLVIQELHPFDFQLKTALLRQSISSVASNSWVKCKKKLTVQKDFAPRIGKKSLWHALRILDFGTQIMIHKRIIDYSITNKNRIGQQSPDSHLYTKMGKRKCISFAKPFWIRQLHAADNKRPRIRIEMKSIDTKIGSSKFRDNLACNARNNRIDPQRQGCNKQDCEKQQSCDSPQCKPDQFADDAAFLF